jgi:hypothetical protein
VAPTCNPSLGKTARPYLKSNLKQKGWGVWLKWNSARLRSIKAPSSSPSIKKKKKKTNEVVLCLPEISFKKCAKEFFWGQITIFALFHLSKTLLIKLMTQQSSKGMNHGQYLN